MIALLLSVISWLVLQFKRHSEIFILIGIAIALLVTVGIYRGCSKSTPKLNEAEIHKAQTAIAVQDRQKMVDVLVSSDVREKAIDENLVDANRQKIDAIAEAKKKAEALSNDELAAELERRSHE